MWIREPDTIIMVSLNKLLSTKEYEYETYACSPNPTQRYPKE